MKYAYVVYEKTYIERLGELIEDETNLWESDSVDDLVELLRSKDVKMARSTIFKAIKTKKPVCDKYFVYKIKK